VRIARTDQFSTILCGVITSHGHSNTVVVCVRSLAKPRRIGTIARVLQVTMDLMSYRVLSSGIAAAIVLLLSASNALAVDPPKLAPGYKVPRTPDGRPDLQGNWSNATLTTLERPGQFKSRALSPEEAEQIEGGAAKHVEENAKPTDPKLGIKDLPTDCGYGFTGTNCGYNNFWVDRGDKVIAINGEKRSSIIVEPADGKMPGFTATARQRMASRPRRGGAYDGPEVRSLGERCLMSFGSSAGPPMLPLMYNNTYTIVQTPDAIMIEVEMVHDVRIVRMKGESLPPDVKRWMGDSRGRWEGDTLVIETTNFHPLQSFRGASGNMKVIERLTRVSPQQIVYQFTVEDPTTFTQPFSGELPFNATRDNLYEYACHEGNYALPGILAGAREEERAAAAKSGGTPTREKSAKDVAKELEGE
jgi:hypothetical protein